MGAPNGVTRELVLSTAEAVVDRDGSQRLGMSALAREVGVRAPSLHHHVGTVEALLADVQVRALADLAGRLQRSAVGKTGPQCFRAMAEALYQYAAAHPGLYELSQSRPLDPDRAWVASEPSRATLTAVIESFGIRKPPLDLLLTCLATLHGAFALERSGAIARPKDRIAVHRRATELVIMLLEHEGRT